MRTRTVGSSVNGHDDARRRERGPARRGSGIGEARWRSHTFSDGVYAITLTGRLDAGVADGLRARLSELRARGTSRLILDVTAAGAAGTAERVLVAKIFAGHAAACEVVVVTPVRSALGGALPAGVSLAQTVSEARRHFGFHARQRTRQRPAPAGRISMGERHVLELRQSLRWAERIAGEGDFERALEALAAVERGGDPLSARWQERRAAWLAASYDDL